ncbi:MAG: bifunctional hydroxymethylpyrimidine kinase/phosphomethylpyrimidine kinase [Duodenibacillus sp.]
MAEKHIRNTLTIAGIDPSGGAGVLADVKVMSALGCYATAVVAALTAQNTQAVTGVMPVPAAFVAAQLDTLFADVRMDAVKIGMLGAVDVMETVAGAIETYRPPKVVLDTVMVAKSGDRLMPDDAVDFFRTRMLPLSDLITPNLPEAEVLLGRAITSVEAMPEAAHALWELCGGNAAVFLKGGHLLNDAQSSDLLYDGKRSLWLTHARVATKNTHGTGCSLSSALAALWAQTDDLFEAAARAKTYISEAIARSDDLDVGHGHGPIHHFYRWNS